VICDSKDRSWALTIVSLARSAEDRATGQIVVLKKMATHQRGAKQEGFPLTTLREINILGSMIPPHPNIVRLLGVVSDAPDSDIFLAMEYAEYDLAVILRYADGG